jgi:TfoX/Sxy family transcriptional regulator of competence genes
MAYSEELADRIRAVLAPRERVREVKMFGGLCLMVNGNMACGVMGEELMVRLDAADAERAKREAGVREMDFTGRPMKSLVIVGPERVADDPGLAEWVDAGADHAASLPPKPDKPDRRAGPRPGR